MVPAVLPLGFPRLYAAASLKPVPLVRLPHGRRHGFPRLYAAASLKHLSLSSGRRRQPVFSAALCRGLIEATVPNTRP